MTRLCETPGCGRVHRAQGCCARCYKRRPEYQAAARAYEQTPERAARRKAHAQKPENKLQAARHRAARWRIDEEQRKRVKELRRRPESKRKAAAYKRRKRADPAYRAQELAALRERETGFSAELFETCWSAQAGACALCSVPMQRDRSQTGVCADHSHSDGLPRGLVCKACNTALGLYERRQRVAGLRIAQYEHYLSNPPARQHATFQF